MEQNFTAEQISELSNLTDVMLAKTNTDRTTPEKPKLDHNDCIIVRHFDKSKLN